MSYINIIKRSYPLVLMAEKLTGFIQFFYVNRWFLTNKYGYHGAIDCDQG